MKVGNVTHAVGLSVIGIGAVLALVLQMKARMAKNVAVQAPLRTVQEKSVPAVPVGLPKVVYGDPFTHTKLPRLQPSASSATKEPGPGKGASDSDVAPPRGLSGSLGFTPVLPDVSAIPKGDAVEDKDAGKTPAPAVKGPMIYLQAIVSANDPVAFIALDGKEPHDYHVGDTIAPGVTITRIQEGAIELHVAKSGKMLRVGEKLQL